ncbi:MAG: 5-formyltetrahydrofolate cyclo-ligase [Rickettsiales bacterium]|jgi:5-formyltetrahydrofolate cyclo-ligase|nr:5-formyltetrahydrofolate cyclo-ligase [Rickettsiales bacterium]
MKSDIKTPLRQKFLTLRQKSNIDIASIIVNLDLFLSKQNYTNIGLYCPINNEIDVLAILPYLHHNKKISLPRINGSKICFYNWDLEPTNLVLNKKFKFLEPPEDKESIIIPEIIITPLIAFDDNLFRLGYGGGYYDRYFAENTNILKVGIASNLQKSETLLPAEDHDIKLDVIITEIA